MTAHELLTKYKELCFSIDYEINELSDYNKDLMFDKIMAKLVLTQTIKDAQKLFSYLLFNDENEKRFASILNTNFQDWEKIKIFKKRKFGNFVSRDKEMFFVTDFLNSDPKDIAVLSSFNVKDIKRIIYKHGKYLYKYNNEEYCLKRSLLDDYKFTISDSSKKTKIITVSCKTSGLCIEKNNSQLHIIQNKDTFFVYDKDYFKSLNNLKKCDENKSIAMIECGSALADKECPFSIVKITVNKDFENKAIIIMIALSFLLMMQNDLERDNDQQLLEGLLLGGIIFRN